MRIRVIGAHLPRLDQEGIRRFIAEDVAAFGRTIRELRERGITDLTDEDIEERALELPGELDADLQTCALFELEVTGNEMEFDPSAFENPETGYRGWEPAFLTMDGGAVLFEGYRAPPDVRDFRVAFYVHEWQEPGRLFGVAGELELPPFTAVPQRLWKLAPYACVD